MRKTKHISLKAFTLIELIVVITIIGIISVSTYLPYAHHQKKVLLKQAAREITQSLRDARSLAINGLDSGSGNLNIALFLEPDSRNIMYYSYPFDTIITLGDIGSMDEYKKKILPRGVAIDTIDTLGSGVLFTFEAISGSGGYDGFSPGNEVSINLSYDNSTSPVLQKEIRYYTQSYISDY